VSAPRQYLLSPEKEVEVVALYQAGRTAKEVADRFGIHRLTVSRAVRRAGGRVGREPLTPREVERAAALYGAGLSLPDVATKLSLPRGSIRRQLILTGVEMRAKGRPSLRADR
jgi:DNA invertase Pin-like site-specific DNA recombinase